VIRRRDARAGLTISPMPGHPATTLLFTFATVAVLFSLFYKEPVNSGIGAGIAITGIPVYFFWRLRNQTHGRRAGGLSPLIGECAPNQGADAPRSPPNERG
jgi:hypothetical protein